MRRCNPTQNTIILISCLFVLAVCSMPVAAQDSLLINYQGLLTGTDGEPLDTSVAITFSIYPEDLLEEALWSETHADVAVTSGMFSVLLGSEYALSDSIFNGVDLYLGIAVGADPEITPRTLLASAPRAAVSHRVNGDIKTMPGVLQLHPPDPCVPPDPCAPVRLEVFPPDPCYPPDPCTPALALIAGEDTTSIVVHPPEPCVPPEPCNPAVGIFATETANSMIINKPPPDDGHPGVTMATTPGMNYINIDWMPPPDDGKPAFEVVSDADLEKISMNLSAPSNDDMPELSLSVDVANMTSGINLLPPPDDNKPAIGMSVNALNNEAALSVTNYSPAGPAPGIVMSAGAEAGNYVVGWFQPPPDDNMPPPDDSKPAAEFNMTSAAGTFELHGEESAIEFVTHPVYMHSDGSGAKMGIGTANLTEALCVIGNIALTGDVVAYTETKLKSNIEPIDNALETIDALNGVRYDWRTDDNPKLRFPPRRQIGLLADDVEKVLPELVHHDADGNRLVAYSKLTAVLIEAVKELKAENEELKSRIEALEQ